MYLSAGHMPSRPASWATLPDQHRRLIVGSLAIDRCCPTDCTYRSSRRGGFGEEGYGDGNCLPECRSRPHRKAAGCVSSGCILLAARVGGIAGHMMSQPTRVARDGMWTLLLNLLSKLQSVALLVCGYHFAGFAGIGVLTTAVGASYLASSAADFGLSNEIARVVAGRPSEQTVQAAERAGVVRVPIALLVSPLAFWLALGRHTHVSWVVYVAIAAFAANLLASTELVAGIGGLGNFAVPTQLVGACRAASSVLAVALIYATHSAASVLWSFVGGEFVGVVTCLIYLRRYTYPENGHTTAATLSPQHLWLGAASVVNVLTNQSDTVLVAAILTPTQLGIFSIASQLQNGVATLALSPASPMTVHAARAAADGTNPLPAVNQARRLTLRLAITMVVLVFGITAICANVFTKLQPLSTHVGIITLLLCLLAAIPSAVSGIYFAVAVGFKEHRRVGLGRLSGGLMSAAVIIGLAEAFTLIGAASGTLIRDLVALTIAYRIATPHLSEVAGDAHAA